MTTEELPMFAVVEHYGDPYRQWVMYQGTYEGCQRYVAEPYGFARRWL